MLSVKLTLHAEDAEAYYTADDYYLGEPGYWQGNDELKEAFGLDGAVEAESFSKLMRGYDPVSGTPISANTGDKNRCAGSDFTFSASKTASLLSYIDENIQKAFDRAVAESLNLISEEYTQCRHKHNGVTTYEKTGKALFAVFKHKVARAPDSKTVPDPQLHAHCVMANVTVDGDGRFMAIHNEFVDKDKIHLVGQYFRNKFAKELQKIGYQIDVTDRQNGFFEIKGVPKEVIEDFSKRAKQVKDEVDSLSKLTYKMLYEAEDRDGEAILKKWAKERVGTADPAAIEAEFEKLRSSDELAFDGWTDARIAVLAVKTSRQRKKNVKEEDIIEQINETLYSHGETLDSLLAKAKAVAPAPPDSTPAKQKIKRAILAAIENRTETEVAYTKEEIVRNALRLTIGEDAPSKSVFAEFDRLIGKEIANLRVETSKTGETAYYSTPELMSIERENIKICVKSKTNYVIDSKIVDEFINKTHKELISKPDGTGFTPGQVDALRHILTTDCQYSVIQGDAGTGKSFSMNYARELFEAHGYKVCGVAPTGKATDELAGAAGITTTMTIDSLIKTADKPLKHGEKYCIIVDESSMGGSRTINELLKVTEEYGAKVIFVGDKKQFQPVGAGKFFSDLQKTAVKITQMKDVIRQKTAQTRNIVKTLGNQEIPEAFNHLTGYAAISAGYDKTDAKNYNKGQRLLFHEYDSTGTADIPSGTTAQIVDVGNELTIEYTVRGRKIEVKIDPRKAHRNFTVYDKNTSYKNCIQEINDNNARQQAVADDYVNCYNADTNTIVVTATNDDRRSLSGIIREKLINQGKIENIGEFSLREPQNIKDFLSADSFSVGQIVKGLPQLMVDGKAGYGVITDIDPNKNRITIQNPVTGESFPIHTPDYAGKQFSVFEHNEKVTLGIGERIAFLKNARITDRNTGKTVNVRNGQLATITELDNEGNVSVKMDKKDITFNINTDYNYFTTAYALSLHKSQGMTVDKVIWDADSQKEVNMSSFYVAITRCKRDVAIYTDNAENLQKKAAKEQEKFSTMDEEFEEEYKKTYKKYRETLQTRKLELSRTAVTPIGDPTSQEAAPPATAVPDAPPLIQKDKLTVTAVFDVAPPSIQEGKPSTIKLDAAHPGQEATPQSKPEEASSLFVANRDDEPTPVKPAPPKPAMANAPPPATATAPAVQAAKPRREYSLMRIGGYNRIPQPNEEDLRKLSDEMVINMTFPPKDCDTFDAATTTLKKMGLLAFINEAWMEKQFDNKRNYSVGVEIIQDALTIARDFQINGVSVDWQVKPGSVNGNAKNDVVCSMSFKPEKTDCFADCFGMEIRDVSADSPKFRGVMKKNVLGYDENNVQTRFEVPIIAPKKDFPCTGIELPLLQPQGDSFKFKGYMQDNGVTVQRKMDLPPRPLYKIAWDSVKKAVYRVKKAVTDINGKTIFKANSKKLNVSAIEQRTFKTLNAAFSYYVPMSVWNIVENAFKNIQKAREYAKNKVAEKTQTKSTTPDLSK